MNVDFHILIPARLDSTRLPQKALADIAGRPLIVHVLERALASGASSVQVATDSDRIAEAVRAGLTEFCLVVSHSKLRGATGAWITPLAIV